MSAIIVCLSAAVLGVDYGWQPVAGGGIEYIIQIEPELLDSLKAGHDLFSDLPAAARNIRSYRITVGSGRLPHHGEPLPPPADKATLTGASAEASAPAAEVDLSQLPGPILGPALILHPPANRSEGDEPPHLVESEAKPLANRVAGYHGKSDGAAAEEVGHGGDREEHRAGKDHSTHKGNLPDVVMAQPADANQEEHASPSDRTPPVPQTATSPVVMQLGLCASLCGNVFLLWVAAGQRSSYRALVRRMFESRSEQLAALPSPSSNTPRFEQVGENESAGSSSKTDRSER